MELQIWRIRVRELNGSLLSTEREYVFHGSDSVAKDYHERKISSLPSKNGKRTIVHAELLEQKTVNLPVGEFGEKINKAIQTKKTLSLPKMIHLFGDEVQRFIV